MKGLGPTEQLCSQFLF